MESRWFVYMVRCDGGEIYTGISTNVERRFKEHLSKGDKCAKYLRGKSGLKLEFSQLVGNRSLATKVELFIKKLSKSKKEMIVRDPTYIKIILESLS